MVNVPGVWRVHVEGHAPGGAGGEEGDAEILEAGVNSGHGPVSAVRATYTVPRASHANTLPAGGVPRPAGQHAVDSVVSWAPPGVGGGVALCEVPGVRVPVDAALCDDATVRVRVGVGVLVLVTAAVNDAAAPREGVLDAVAPGLEDGDGLIWVLAHTESVGKTTCHVEWSGATYATVPGDAVCVATYVEPKHTMTAEPQPLGLVAPGGSQYVYAPLGAPAQEKGCSRRDPRVQVASLVRTENGAPVDEHENALPDGGVPSEDSVDDEQHAFERRALAREGLGVGDVPKTPPAQTASVERATEYERWFAGTLRTAPGGADCVPTEAPPKHTLMDVAHPAPVDVSGGK